MLTGRMAPLSCKEHFDVSRNATLRKAISYFHRQEGIDPNLFLNNPRGIFHDAMHVLANQMNASLRGEFEALIHEIVFMRGFWPRRNKENAADFVTPPVGILPYRNTCFNAKFATDFIALVQKRPRSDLKTENALPVYESAVRKEARFREKTHGRALYQLTVEEMLDLPLTVFELGDKPPAPVFFCQPAGGPR